MTSSEEWKRSPETTTRVSTKGQVILPKAIRDLKNWAPGTALTVEVTEEGVLLRNARAFPPTRLEDVFGMIPYDGPRRTIEDMDAGIALEVTRRHDRGRY